MSVERRVYSAASVTWATRLGMAVLSMVLVPVLFRHLGKEEIGIWFMLGQSTGFLALMDLGLGSTLTRRIAFAAGNANGGQIALGNLVATGRAAYRLLALGVFVVAWGIGAGFLAHIELREITWTQLLAAWTLMCCGHAITVWASLWSCLLQGVGEVTWDVLVSTVLQVLVLAVQLLAVWLGGGLVTLALVQVSGALATRLVTRMLLRVRRPDVLEARGRFDPALLRELARPALRAWITGLGAFLILKTDQYFIAYFLSPVDIPNYHATYLLVFNLYTLAVALASASQVFVSQLWTSGQHAQVRALVRRSLRFTLITMGCGIVVLMAAGQWLIETWLGPGNFPGYALLAIFCATLLLEAQHVGLASASRATEDEAFAGWALGAGLLNLVFTWILVQRLGLLGVALGTLAAQLLTNNWYAVHRGLTRLRIGYGDYAREVLAPVAGVIVVAVMLAYIARAAVPDGMAPWLSAGAVLVACGAVWITAVTRLVFRAPA